MTSIPILDGVRDLAERYPVWLCDIWGVLHNGVNSFRDASDALARHREAGGVVVLITNAPRPNPSIARQLAGLGVSATAYDAIVTSGDVTRTLIAAEKGRGLYHLGPERDRTLFEGLPVSLVGLDAAEFAVCSGLFDDVNETPENYREQLASMRARAMPMICANPDLIVERGSSICYCAGAIGAAYEAVGGQVAYAGKPKRPIYDAALKRVSAIKDATVAKRRVLAIGDGLLTDILGAHDFGIDSLFVASGIHLDPGKGMTETGLSQLFAGSPSRPLAAVERLVW